MKPLQDETWKLAKEIVSRHYTPEDIKDGLSFTKQVSKCGHYCKR